MDGSAYAHVSSSCAFHNLLIRHKENEFVDSINSPTILHKLSGRWLVFRLQVLHASDQAKSINCSVGLRSSFHLDFAVAKTSCSSSCLDPNRCDIIELWHDCWIFEIQLHNCTLRRIYFVNRIFPKRHPHTYSTNRNGNILSNWWILYFDQQKINITND